ncbi:MAG: T9SS type A sorting domain-containing protein [Bacteroidota bacterium]
MTFFSSVKIYSAFALLLFSGVLQAQTYYISPMGDDNASGTSITSPWKTIAKINNQTLAPGTTVLFEGGQTFSGSIYIDNADANDADNCVVFSSYGNGKAIIQSGINSGFQAQNTQGITISNLIFEGAGMAANTADGVLINTTLSGNIKLRKVTIKGIEVSNYGKTGILLLSTSGNTGFKDVLIDSVHVHHVKKDGIVTRGFTMQSHVGWAHQNITIKNSEVDNVPGYADPTGHRGSGIILGQVDNGLIEKTAAHHNGSNNIHCGGPGGIWAWDCNNITIQFCESYFNSSGSGCDGLGFDLDGGVTNSLMQYNYSHNNDGAGYLLGQYDYARPWVNNVIRYNISENDGRTNGGGITLFKGPGTTMTGAKIYNNTIYISPSATNSGAGGFTIIDWNQGISGIEVNNNIFQSTGNAPLIDIPANYSAHFAGNLYWSSGGAFKIKYQGSTYTNLASWRTATGNELSGNNPIGIVGNPSLKNAGNGGTLFPNPTTQLNAYQLESNSIAIDAGLDLMGLYGFNGGSRDFFNNTIYDGAIADIGAHEVTLSTAIASGKAIGSEIAFYPNPVKSGDPIFVKGAEPPYDAELFSITGARVWKEDKIESKEEHSIPTINLAAGLYILSVVDVNDKKRVNKVIVE